MLRTLFFLLFPVTAYAIGWSADNNPHIMNRDFAFKLNLLPTSGKLRDQRLGWPGSHWASFVGGIANRWSAGTPQNFTYKLNSLADLKKLEPHQLNELSPAEKFDIFSGNYSYPKVKQVFRTVSPDQDEWHGICHGYAPAALNFPEPASVTLTNADGIVVHFYSSDVAALMSFYYANVVSTPVTLIGNRCFYNENSRIPRRAYSACQDMNPGAFHIVLTNKLGIEGAGFIADIERYLEVWNHVAVRYETIYKGEFTPVNTSAFRTAKRVQVETIVTFAAAIAPKFDPVLNTDNASYAGRRYEYYLDLDSDGNVIGGDWISEVRPDFLWTQKKVEFLHDWSNLNQIYRPAIDVQE